MWFMAVMLPGDLETLEKSRAEKNDDIAKS